MRNYPLLKHNGVKTWYAWIHTYLEPLNQQICALWNHSNYFLPDYCEYELETNILGSAATAIDVSELPYNGYFRAIDETILCIGTEITGVTLNPGYLVVSKARNEENVDYKSDIDNYFIQPFGYGSFYIFTYNENSLIGIYDQYAEENFGLNYSFSLFSTHPRFIWQGKDEHDDGDRKWVISSQIGGEGNVVIADGTWWTDPYVATPMVFWYSGDEEVVVDAEEYISVKIDETNIVQYNILMLEETSDSTIWPEEIEPRII